MSFPELRPDGHPEIPATSVPLDYRTDRPMRRCQVCGSDDFSRVVVASCDSCSRWWAACEECGGHDYTTRSLRGHVSHTHRGNLLRGGVSGTIPFRGRK